MDNEEKVELANKLYNKLNEKCIGVILDDRENISIGAKIKDAKVLGTPNVIVIGDRQEGEEFEVENVKTGEKSNLKMEDL